MLTIIVVCNVTIALLLGMITWYIWCWRSTLGQIANTLGALEKSTYAVLLDAPDVIYRAQMGVYQLQELTNYQQLEFQLQQLKQALRLISWGQRAWPKQFNRPLSRQTRKNLPRQRR